MLRPYPVDDRHFVESGWRCCKLSPGSTCAIAPPCSIIRSARGPAISTGRLLSQYGLSCRYRAENDSGIFRRLSRYLIVLGEVRYLESWKLCTNNLGTNAVAPNHLIMNDINIVSMTELVCGYTIIAEHFSRTTSYSGDGTQGSTARYVKGRQVSM